MGTLSLICELRGKAREGRGCTLIAGLARCAKRNGGALTTTGTDDCTTMTFDAILEPAVIDPNTFYLNIVSNRVLLGGVPVRMT